jgi:hypothetical protein
MPLADHLSGLAALLTTEILCGFNDLFVGMNDLGHDQDVGNSLRQ